MVNYSKLFVILLVPVIALFSWPFGGKQNQQYGKHVIFALYFLSFLMLVMVIYAKILVWLPVRVPPHLVQSSLPDRHDCTPEIRLLPVSGPQRSDGMARGNFSSGRIDLFDYPLPLACQLANPALHLSLDFLSTGVKKIQPPPFWYTPTFVSSSFHLIIGSAGYLPVD